MLPGPILIPRESSSVVELHLAKVDVAGSNPVSRYTAEGRSEYRVAFFSDNRFIIQGVQMVLVESPYL